MRPSLPNPFSEPLTSETLRRYLQGTAHLYDTLRKTSELYEVSDRATDEQRTLVRHAQHCLDSCESAALLSGKALYVPATAVVRMGLEHIFYFAACVKNPGYWSQLQACAEESTRKQIRELVKRGQMSQDSIRTVSETEKVASQAILIVAQKAGLENLYHGMYRSLSQYGAHATTLRIDAVFSDPEVAERSGIDFREFPQLIWPAYLLGQIHECLRELFAAFTLMISQPSESPSP